MELQRDSVTAWWDEAWTDGLWAAPWKKAVEGLTPQQAAWTPGPGRNSIWQIVNHMIFWREVTLNLLAGKPRPARQEQERLNFLAPANITDAEWNATRERFEGTQRRLREAIANPKTPLDRVPYHIPHDAYHVGQIMYLRSLQGLPPIE